MKTTRHETTPKIDAGTALRARNVLSAASMMLHNHVGRELLEPILSAEPARFAVHFEGTQPEANPDEPVDAEAGCNLAVVGSLWTNRVERVTCPVCRRRIYDIVKAWTP